MILIDQVELYKWRINLSYIELHSYKYLMSIYGIIPRPLDKFIKKLKIVKIYHIILKIRDLLHKNELSQKKLNIAIQSETNFLQNNFF